MALTPWRLGSCRLHFVPAPGEAESQRRGMTAISLADGDSAAAPRSGFSPEWPTSAASQVCVAWQPRQNRRCLLVSWLGRAGPPLVARGALLSRRDRDRVSPEEAGKR